MAVRDGRRAALPAPRIDMPGARVEPGASRQLIPPPLPDQLPALEATVGIDGEVRLTWEHSARTLGLVAELHRGDREDFPLRADTMIGTTTTFRFADRKASAGTHQT